MPSRNTLLWEKLFREGERERKSEDKFRKRDESRREIRIWNSHRDLLLFHCFE